MDMKAIREALANLAHTATERTLEPQDYADICKAVSVTKMYYDIDLGLSRYINPRTNKLIVSDNIIDGKIILYDEQVENDLVLCYPYYYNGKEYVHAYIEFPKGIKKEELDLKMYQFLADQIFLMVSKQNLRIMLDFAEMFDDRTSISNLRHLIYTYNKTMQKKSPKDYVVLYINLRNFKYINEMGGISGGDEAIIKYAHKLYALAGSDDCACRIGGDNFAMFVHKDRLEEILKELEEIKISGLSMMPEKEFGISAWIGISPELNADEGIDMRIEHASVACALGKNRYKQRVTYYTKELAETFIRSRELTAMFRPAVEKHEFQPFFQPKVNMLTGELIGMEALCRWIHDGKMIFPDQFIPVFDKQGLIHELDMTILDETCRAIKKWHGMGLEPPRISVNISRKNLFVQGIEERIASIIDKHSIPHSLIEVEITETAKEDEFNRLIEFLANLKKIGLRISIDDFGTGYSSLSLIHNINADIVKIDKSFVSSLLSDKKSGILIETIIQIAKRLGMEIIAEGIETPYEGKALIELGCVNAQGYYYSRPVDFDSASKIIEKHGYEPLE